MARKTTAKIVTAINKKTGEVRFCASRREAAKLLGDKPWYEQKVSKIISSKCSETSYKGWIFRDGKLNVEEMYLEFVKAQTHYRGGPHKAIPVIGTDLATGIQIEFSSMSEAAAFARVRVGAVSAVCAAPERRQTNGYVFEVA